MPNNCGTTYSYLGAAAIVGGAALLHRTVLPDSPNLAFFLSLSAGTAATALTGLLRRGPF
jgi:hypothetical protein